MPILGEVVEFGIKGHAGYRSLFEGDQDTVFGKVDSQVVMKMPVRAGYDCTWRRMTASLY